MATINLGRIKPVFRGAYSGSTAYVVDDIVTDGNETFICIQAHGAGTQATSVTAYWSKLAAKGGDVTQLTTQGDIVYRDGSGVARLAAGTAGQFLKTGGAGANPSWAGSGLAIQAVHTASTLTAVAGRAYPINTTSNACTITLPASATAGDEIKFIDYARTWGTNNVSLNSGSLKFQGNTPAAGSEAVFSTTGQSVTILYVDATQGWIPTVDDDVAHMSLAPYDVDYLVVAGAGGGGSDSNDVPANNSSGGGGGAGGYRAGTGLEIYGGSTYTLTVGAGGAGGGAGSVAPSGTASSFAGGGITTITAAGGGGGGCEATNGAVGGSGGGGGYPNDGPAGTGGAGNTPSTSPAQGYAGGNAGPTTGGGGGGSSEAGDTDGDTQGGDGTSNSITGSAVVYAGGGASGGQGVSTTGGTGGGANGSGGQGVAGTDGLGGGGSGSGSTGTVGDTGGKGGDGVVILRIPSASYTGTVTGSPTVTTDGSFKVVKWTQTGTYLA